MDVGKEEVIKIEISEEMKIKADIKSKRILDSIKDREDLEPRDEEWRKKDLYKGEIAELAVCKFLEENKKKFEKDDSDINNDLIVFKGGKPLRVEVKSSGPTENTPNLEVCLKSRNLAVKPGEEKEINIQTYYFLDDSEKYIYLISWIDWDNLIWLDKNKGIKRNISKYSIKNPRKRFDSILGTLRSMEELLGYID